MGLWINNAGVTKYPEGKTESRTTSSSIPDGLQTTVKGKTEELLEDNISDCLYNAVVKVILIRHKGSS